jgi:preprotein translocase subunit SecA
MQMRHGAEPAGGEDEAAASAQPRPSRAPARVSVQPVRREGPKIGRNDPCPCGSGQKFKKCHGAALEDEPDADDATA